MFENKTKGVLDFKGKKNRPWERKKNSKLYSDR